MHTETDKDKPESEDYNKTNENTKPTFRWLTFSNLTMPATS